jgi:hypothetical protein
LSLSHSTIECVNGGLPQFVPIGEAGLRGWISLLRAMEGHIKLAEARPGMLVEHAKELHRRTQGRIASNNLLDRVSYLAITSGAETITADLIAATTIDNAAQVSNRTA